ncbi:MAG: LytTR family DNA-binding domain-containing protein [Acidobacteriota bacterium]
MIRAIIADDERLARQKVRELASAHPDLQIVAECANGKQALAAIREHHPDLVFLDIRMPGIDGFGVVRELRGEALPRIVFVTAHNEYAVEAFDVEAVDYLLKPFDRARFDRTVDRVRREGDAGARRRLLDALDRLVTAPERSATHFVVRAREKIVFIDPHEVTWIGAEGKYVRLHLTPTVTHLVRQSIAEVERRLDPSEFLRIHRSTIVNLRRVKEMHRGVGDDFVVLLADGTQLSLSRRYRARLADFV